MPWQNDTTPPGNRSPGLVDGAALYAAPIASATSVPQLHELTEAAHLQLDETALDQLNEASHYQAALAHEEDRFKISTFSKPHTAALP